MSDQPSHLIWCGECLQPSDKCRCLKDDERKGRDAAFAKHACETFREAGKGNRMGKVGVERADILRHLQRYLDHRPGTADSDVNALTIPETVPRWILCDAMREITTLRRLLPFCYSCGSRVRIDNTHLMCDKCERVVGWIGTPNATG